MASADPGPGDRPGEWPPLALRPSPWVLGPGPACTGEKLKGGGAGLACLSVASPRPGRGHAQKAEATSPVQVQGQSKPEPGPPQHLGWELLGTFKGALAFLFALNVDPGSGSTCLGKSSLS